MRNNESIHRRNFDAKNNREKSNEFPIDINKTSRAFDRHFEVSESNRAPQKFKKYKLNPTFVGIVTAAIFAITIVADVIHNGPSSFVVNNPEAATTLLATGAATVGLGAAKITEGANAKEPAKSDRTRQKERRIR